MNHCIDCAKFSFKQAKKEWLDLGFGNCELREVFIMFGANKERDCKTFVAAAPDTAQKRRAWLAHKKEQA